MIPSPRAPTSGSIWSDRDESGSIALLPVPTDGEVPRVPPPEPKPQARGESRRVATRNGRRAVIVSVEGALLDAGDAQALSWLVALHDHGRDVSLDLLRPLMGLTAPEVLRLATGLKAASDDGCRILRRRSELFRTWYLRRLLPFLGSRALLQRLRREGLRIIAATAVEIEEAASVLYAAGIGDLLDDAVAHDESAGIRTHADVVEAAVVQCAAVRDSIILLGNTPYDVEAGRKAGVPVVALRCGGWRDAALVGSTAIYDDPRDLLIHFDDSPFSVGARGVSRRRTAPERAPATGLSLVQ